MSLVETPRLTTRQWEYVAFIREFTRLHDKAPAEAEIAQYFRVSGPSVHTMLVKLEQMGAIARQRRTARSIRVLVAPSGQPHFDRLPAPGPGRTAAPGVGGTAISVAQTVVNELFAEVQRRAVDDEDFVPLLAAVARAAGIAVIAGGGSESEGCDADRAVLEFAAQSYARLCAMNDPEDADEDEDTGRFWTILRDQMGP